MSSRSTVCALLGTRELAVMGGASHDGRGGLRLAGQVVMGRASRDGRGKSW